MDNKTIYKRTLGFSIRRLLWDILSVILVGAAMALGFLITDKAMNNGLIGLAIGGIVAIILIAIFSRWVGYTYKAGQIAMMTKGVTEGKLPENVIDEGKKVVKERFVTVAAYFAVTGVIKGIFRLIGRGITAIGEAIGGNNGGAIGSTISAIIETIIAYLCDCCLGWVFYRKDQKASKATMEGAVIFFKHGKTLLKNLGRIFGISLLSFAVIGGIFFGISWLIFQAFPDAFSTISSEITEQFGSNPDFPTWISDPATLTLVTSVVIGIIMWSILHSTFIRPFILVGVLRNFINSGKEDTPSEKSFAELEEKMPRLKKYEAKLEAKTA